MFAAREGRGLCFSCEEEKEAELQLWWCRHYPAAAQRCRYQLHAEGLLQVFIVEECYRVGWMLLVASATVVKHTCVGRKHQPANGSGTGHVSRCQSKLNERCE